MFPLLTWLVSPLFASPLPLSTQQSFTSYSIFAFAWVELGTSIPCCAIRRQIYPRLSHLHYCYCYYCHSSSPNFHELVMKKRHASEWGETHHCCIIRKQAKLESTTFFVSKKSRSRFCIWALRNLLDIFLILKKDIYKYIL